MAKLSGKDGSVTVASTAILITGWNFTKANAIKDVSDSGSTSGKDYLPDGLYEVSGSFEGFVIDATAQPALGASAALELIVDDSPSIKWAGSGILTSQNETLQIVGGEAVKVSYDFQGTGAWTRTDATT